MTGIWLDGPSASIASGAWLAPDFKDNLQSQPCILYKNKASEGQVEISSEDCIEDNHVACVAEEACTADYRELVISYIFA